MNNFSRTTFILVFFISFLSFTVARAEIYRSLKLGSYGADVKELQQILNSDPETEIAQTGVGSKGQETQYFGLLTKNAVIRLQNKYKDDILTPVGLNFGTGMVGPMTLAKIKTLKTGNMAINKEVLPVKPTEIPVSSPVSSPEVPKIDIYTTDKIQQGYQSVLWERINSAINSQSKPDLGDIVTKVGSSSKVLIYAMTKSVVKVGDSVEISGYGVNKETYVYFGNDYRVKPKTVSGQSLIFTVPNLPLGRYDIALSNLNGISQTAVLVITSDGVSKLKVTETDPQNVSFGETITIKGEGFSSGNNEVRTSYGRILNISSSDGKSISFKVEPEALRETVKSKTFNQLYPVEFIVVNSNGVSEPKQFTIRY